MEYAHASHASAEVDEEAAVAVVDGEEEGGVGGDGDAGDVRGGLEGERGGFGLEEVGDGYAVTDRGE